MVKNMDLKLFLAVEAKECIDIVDKYKAMGISRAERGDIFGARLCLDTVKHYGAKMRAVLARLDIIEIREQYGEVMV